MLAGWEGSVHDANILAGSMDQPDGINIFDDKFYLGDFGYTCQPSVVAPFRKTRYYLNDLSSKNYPRTTHDFLNLSHSSLRVMVDTTFGSL